MLKLVEEKPDVTLEEMRAQLDLPIKKSQISNLLHKAGYHFKKMLYARERDRRMLQQGERNGQRNSLC